MTNRDKVNALSNREMAVLWDYIKSNCAGSNCVFYACPDCGGDCLKGFEAWLGLECEAEENTPVDNKAEKLSKKLETVFITNGDKIKSMDNAELAKVLCQSKEFDKCNYCSYLTPDTLYCHKESCVDGIKAWLDAPSANEPDNPPADKHVDLQKVSEKVCDNVNHPAHYNRAGAMECIREMVVILGYEATINFCNLNAWKYRYRSSEKNGAEDMAKSDWYVKKADELKAEAGYF